MTYCKMNNPWMLAVLAVWTMKEYRVLTSHVNNELCLGDLQLLTEPGARNLLLTILDSTGKPPSGLLMGNLNWDGNPEQCRRAKFDFEGFHTHYCSVYWHFKNDTSKDALLRGRLGLCLPRSCTSGVIIQKTQELQRIIPLISLLQPGSVYQNVFSIIQKVGVSDVICSKENQSFSPEGKLILALLVCYVCFVMVVSAVGYIHTRRIAESDHSLSKEASKTGNLSSITRCFSIYRNLREITDEKEKEREIDYFFNILRTVSFLQVVVIFVYFKSFLDGPAKYIARTINMKGESDYNDIIHTSPIDTFLFIGGFLFAKSYTKTFQRGVETTTFLTILASRYLRLVPAFMCVVYFRWALWSLLFNGSYWQDEFCQNSSMWKLWSTFFEYTETENCLSVGWYISCEFKFFMLAMLIMLCIRRSELAGKLVFATLWITTFVAAVVFDIKYWKSNSFDANYLQYWMFFFFNWRLRFGSYLIGLLLGISWVTSKGFQKHRFGSAVGVPWILLGITCILLSTYRRLLFGETFLLSSFSYVCAWNVWTVGLAAALIGVQLTDFSKWISKLGSRRSLRLLNCLSYSASLLVEPVLDYVVHSRGHTVDYTPAETIVLIIGVIVVTFAVAFPFYLMFELPFVQLGKLLRKTN